MQFTAGGMVKKFTYDELFPTPRTRHEQDELDYRRTRRREVSNEHLQ